MFVVFVNKLQRKKETDRKLKCDTMMTGTCVAPSVVTTQLVSHVVVEGTLPDSRGVQGS